MLPHVWTPKDEAQHIEHCERVIDITKLGDSEPRQMCGCGEASRHTPHAVARAELDLLTTNINNV